MVFSSLRDMDGIERLGAPGIIHLPVELRVRGLEPSRVPSSSEEIDAM
jgi:hypothetical protein